MEIETPRFFTKQELADRWRCTRDAIDKMVKAGAFSPSRKLPGWKISRETVLKLEEVGYNPLSPFERRRLDQEIKRQQREISNLRAIIDHWGAVSLEAMAQAKDTQS